MKNLRLKIKKLWKCINRFRYWIVGCIVFLVFVQILYTIPAPSEWLEAKFDAGDLISFVGTIVLGIVAIIQTKEANEQAKVANEMSNRLMQLEENRYKLETRPFIILKDWDAFFENFYNIINCHEKLYVQSTHFELTKGKNAFCVALELLNTTQAYVTVQIKDVRYIDENRKVLDVHSYANTNNMNLRLNPGEFGTMVFWGEREKMIAALRYGKIRVNFYLENRFGERYQESFDAIVIVKESCKEEGKPFVVVSASDYRIGKFIKGSDEKLDLVWEDTNNRQA